MAGVIKHTLGFRKVVSKNSLELMSEVSKVGITRLTLVHGNMWFGKRKDERFVMRNL